MVFVDVYKKFNMKLWRIYVEVWDIIYFFGEYFFICFFVFCKLLIINIRKYIIMNVIEEIFFFNIVIELFEKKIVEI